MGVPAATVQPQTSFTARGYVDLCIAKVLIDYGNDGPSERHRISGDAADGGRSTNTVSLGAASDCGSGATAAPEVLPAYE
jgi:hypothetical protein